MEENVKTIMSTNCMRTTPFYNSSKEYYLLFKITTPNHLMVSSTGKLVRSSNAGVVIVFDKIAISCYMFKNCTVDAIRHEGLRWIGVMVECAIEKLNVELLNYVT